MNLYKLGLGAPSSWIPGVAEPLRNRAGEIVAGVQLIRSGAPRMYEVGASEKQELVAPNVEGVVSFLEDVGKGIFLLLGLFVVVGALNGGKRE